MDSPSAAAQQSGMTRQQYPVDSRNIDVVAASVSTLSNKSVTTSMNFGRNS